MKEKGIIPETQAGFRKKKETMNNIYVLQHVIKKELRRRGGKMFGFFMDLKAAFDRVDRKVLWEVMEKRGIRKGLIERVKEIYESTTGAVRWQDGRSEWFWIEKEVRQRCPLSLLLFSILISDVEEEMRKGYEGGVLVGKERIWTLAYADDVIIMARKDEEDMKEMLKRMERYLRKKKLQLSTEKSKMIGFKKGGEEREWKWEGEKIEEVTEFKYLGYVMRRNGENESEIRELKKKANVVRQIWGTGEYRFKDDFRRRMILFKYFVLRIVMYGAEVWGWGERKELEVVQKKYVKWSLNLDSYTPDYIVYKKANIEKLCTIASRRAIRFEEKTLKNGGKTLIIECIKEKEN